MVCGCKPKINDDCTIVLFWGDLEKQWQGKFSHWINSLSGVPGCSLGVDRNVAKVRIYTDSVALAVELAWLVDQGLGGGLLEDQRQGGLGELEAHGWTVWVGKE